MGSFFMFLEGKKKEKEEKKGRKRGGNWPATHETTMLTKRSAPGMTHVRQLLLPSNAQF
jgi:hypothetical protein